MAVSRPFPPSPTVAVMSLVTETRPLPIANREKSVSCVCTFSKLGDRGKFPWMLYSYYFNDSFLFLLVKWNMLAYFTLLG